ncbi:MAG: hypothetical protein HDR37_07550 [Treponema sp.]|nr:hypothetical protein [Treponema sp.]
MNFKRLRGIYAVALITIAAALFAGCMNSMAGSVSGGENRGVATLHFSATGIPEEYAKEFDAYNDRLNARTILPDNPFDITTDNTLVFVLEGNSAGDTYGPQKVVLVSIGQDSNNRDAYDFMIPGTPNTAVAMDPKLWTLTLTAYVSDASAGALGYDDTKPVLQGRTIVDLRNGSGTATIQMGIGGLPTPASVTVSGMIVDPNNLASYAKAGIYKKIGLEDVGGTTAPTEENITFGTTVVPGVTFNPPVADDIKKSFEFNANGNDVSPGKYLFIINFYNAAGTIVGSYTDTIVINPGNELKQVIETPIYMRTLPSAPTGLMASVIKDDGDTYLLKVEWTESTNVTNYELNLSTFDDVDTNSDGDYQNEIDAYFTHTAAVTDRTDSDYSDINNGRITNGQVYGVSLMPNAAAEGVIDFITPGGIIGDESSPMMYGDSSCVLRLKTGKVYEIQLRARNFFGASNWVDRVDSVATNTPDTVKYRYKAPDDQRINRMYVEYNLNGGDMTLTSSITPYPGNYYVDYWSWTKNASLIKETETPAEAGVTYFSNFANKSGTVFDAWKLKEGTAIDTDGNETSTSDALVNAYTYKNAKVIASFGNKLSGSVTQEDKMVDIARTDVAFNVYAADGSEVGITTDATSGISVLEKLTDGKNNILQIQLKQAFNTGDFSATALYTNVKCKAWVGDYATAPIKTLEMDSVYGVFKLTTAGYDPGDILNIMVIADTKTVKDASQTYQFVIR